MRQRFLYCLLLLSTYLNQSQPVLAAGLPRINPLRVEERILPGETREGSIEVTNLQKKVMHVKIYTQDWVYSPDGNGSRNFAPPGRTPFSCTEWLRIHPNQLALAPGESQKIRYTVSVPPEAQGGYHSVIFFESLLGQANPQHTGFAAVDFSARITCSVSIEVLGTIKKNGAVSSLQLVRTASAKPLEMNLSFKNEGNTHLTVEPVFNLLNQEGGVVARGNFPKIYTLPDGSSTVSTTWAGHLAEGTYDFILTIDMGDNQVLVKEWKISVSNTGVIQEQLS